MSDDLSEPLLELGTSFLSAPGGSSGGVNVVAGAGAAVPVVAAPGVVVRRLVGLVARQTPLIDPGSDLTGIPLPSRTTVPLTESDVGSAVVVAFEHNDPHRPIVLGKLWGGPDVPPGAPREGTTLTPWVVQADDHRLVIAADHQLELRCGEASIILTRSGKVLIRGEYLSSRSSGVNRIQGGSVQIN